MSREILAVAAAELQLRVTPCDRDSVPFRADFPPFRAGWRLAIMGDVVGGGDIAVAHPPLLLCEIWIIALSDTTRVMNLASWLNSSQ